MKGRQSAIDEPDWAPPPPGGASRAPAVLSLLALCALAAFHAANISYRVRRETRPPMWDQSNHLEIAKDYQELLAAGRWKEAARLRPKPGMPPFPPLYHLSIQYALRAKDPARAALWVNCAYLALLCLSLWGIGVHFDGPWAGLGAALLFSCAPEVQWLASTQLVDLALVAWVAAAYWALLESETFARLWPSLAFAVLFSAAMLTKWSAFSYFFPALWLAAKASESPILRRRSLAAGLLAAALTAPWYLAQLPVLLPRLVDASADNAVTVASLSGLLSYPLQLIYGFETPLFVLGIVAAAVPTVGRRKDQLPTLMLWLAASLVFWTLVPNRQLRYLLPGLAPLAVAAATTWPRGLLVPLCAFQLVSAANFTRAFLPHVSPTILLPISLFRSDPPAAEAWPLEGVLKEAARLHQGPPEFGNIAVVANAPYLNCSGLSWERRRLGLGEVRIRGVNRRQCELAEFVLVKTGSLGPAGVTGGLPEAREILLDPKGWFLRAYREARRWPLPDRTEAALFRRALMGTAPVADKVFRYDYYEEGDVQANRLRLDFGSYDAARGVYPRARVSADELTIRGLALQRVSFELEDLSLVPVRFKGKVAAASQPDNLLDFRLLRLKRLRLLSAAVSAPSAEEFAKGRLKWLEGPSVRLDKEVSVSASFHGVPLKASADARLSADGRSVEVRLTRAEAFGVPLPRPVLGLYGRWTLDLRPSAELPFEVYAPGLSISGGRLLVGT